MSVTKSGMHRRMSHRFIGLLKARDLENRSETFGDLAERLGDLSFAWCLFIFGLVNMVPLPPGSNMITSLPLLVVAMQMTVGTSSVRLPRFIAEKPLPRESMRRGIARFRPVFRFLEQLARPRLSFVLAKRYRRTIGIAVFIVAFTLFLPLPLSGWGPTLSILIISFGLIERDGGIVIGGLVAGVVAILIVAAMAFAISFGVAQLPIFG